MEVSKKIPERSMASKKVPVVYYLSRNGLLEHPHFMEVSLSSPRGLHLTDVLNRLDFLRGKGMASLYSWSAKRNYKNGFVWHDLSENDLIHPSHANEYILKGSELLHTESSPQNPNKSDLGFTPIRRKNTQWSSRSLDLSECKVYKTDIATQTEEKRRRRRSQAKEDVQEENPRSELACDEISPPPSSSSPETIENVIKSDGNIIGSAVGNVAGGGENSHSGRFRASASAVVMHLISCGSFSIVPPCRNVAQRGLDEQEGLGLGLGLGFSGIRGEEKEYYSGSLVETKKDVNGGDAVAEFSLLKRSSSYNAERNGNGLEDVTEKDVDDIRAKCIPLRPKPATATKRINNERTLGHRREEGNEGEKLARVGEGVHV